MNMSMHVAICLWMNEQDDKRRPIEKLMNAVIEVTGITEEEIMGKNRQINKSFARQLFCFVGNCYSGISKVELGKYLGTDHSTVYHRVESFRASLSQNFMDAETKLSEVKKILRIP